MEITGLGYFTERAQAAHTQQLGLLREKQFFRLLHKDTDSSSYSQEERAHQQENRKIHTLNNMSTMTKTHPLRDKHVLVGSKTKLSIEKPLSRDG